MTHHEIVKLDARALFEVLDDSLVEKQLAKMSQEIAALATSGKSAPVAMKALLLKRHRLTGTTTRSAADARCMEQSHPAVRG